LVRDDVMCKHQHSSPQHRSAAPADDLVDFFNTEKKKRASNLQQEEKELLVELVVTKYHNIIEYKATDVASVKMKIDGWATLAKEFNSTASRVACLRWFILAAGAGL